MAPPSRRRAARANFLGTGATVFISIAQAFVLMPLCVDRVGPTLYGAWLGASDLLVWIQLFDLGIPNLMAQRTGAAIGKGDRERAGRWFASGLVLLICVAGVLLMVGNLLAPFVARRLQVPAPEAVRFSACFQVGVAASVLILLFNAFVSLSWGLQRTVLLNATTIAGAVAGFVVSVVLLLSGWGLWALAAGIAARAGVSIVGALAFFQTVRRRERLKLAPSAAVLREIVSLTPPMAAANVGYVLANNSEIVLVSTFFGPATGLVYALTRRAADGLRSVLDNAAWAVYGGFAHLVTSEDRHRARAVLTEVLSLRFGAACLFGAVYVAVNEGFVTRLFGAEHFGGLWLTMAFTIQMIVSGQSFLINYLYRAAGHIRAGSWWLAGEAVARVLAMFAGLRTAGLVAAPLAASLTAATAAVLTVHRLKASLAESPEPAGEIWRRLAAIGVLGIGIAVGVSRPEPSWPILGAIAALLLVAGGLAILRTQPAHSRARILSGWMRP